MTADLVAIERNKYERIWECAQYRRNSPGEGVADRFVLDVGPSPGARCYDIGCGSGRGAAVLQRVGLDVVGVDIAANCLDPGIELELVVGCLWELELDPREYCICADVMEHIPLEHVEDVLDRVARWVVGVSCFQIACFLDSLGEQLIGMPLHLTVESSGWWLELLAQRWDKVTRQGPDSRPTFYCEGPK